MRLQRVKTVERIVEAGVVAVIRADSADEAVQLAEACRRGGVAAIEITFTTPGAEGAIRELARRPARDFVLGAGTVLDPETARIAILAGAEYLVTPALEEATLRLANRYQVPCIPGAMTVADVIRAMECGADLVKLFPGELFGPSAIRAIHGPLPQANLVPTGGVTLDNVAEWIEAGAAAVGVGGSLTRPAQSGGLAAVTDTARRFVERVQAARKGM
jgi:2-dehydro-3-deoxyphosphogluconate aldolase/(4S)-4-hydroxy-2-oxoglutarate aldolase